MDFLANPILQHKQRYLITLFIIWEQVLINKKVDKIRKQLVEKTKCLGYSTAPQIISCTVLLLGLGMGFH